MTGKAFFTHLIQQDIAIWALDGELEIEADEGVLTDELLTQIRERKAELLRLLTPKPCQRCNAAMENIEAGYFSCPACHFQIVERHSGFFDPKRTAVEADALRMIEGG